MIRASLNSGTEPGSFGAAGANSSLPWATGADSKYSRVQRLESATAENQPSGGGSRVLSGNEPVVGPASAGQSGGAAMMSAAPQFARGVPTPYQAKALAGHAVERPQPNQGRGRGGIGDKVRTVSNIAKVAKAAKSIAEKGSELPGKIGEAMFDSEASLGLTTMGKVALPVAAALGARDTWLDVGKGEDAGKKQAQGKTGVSDVVKEAVTGKSLNPGYQAGKVYGQINEVTGFDPLALNKKAAGWMGEQVNKVVPHWANPFD
jgi:hypothetical protein